MKIKQGQCFLDKVLQGTGDVENAFEMAMLNGIGITDSPSIDTELQNAGITKPYITNFWQSNIKEPANDVFIPYESLKSGISYWTINLDFIIQ